MSTNGRDDLWLPKEYFENRKKFPLDEVAKYAGRYIAWSWQGDRILDSDEDDSRLWHKLVAAGIDPQRAVIDYVDDL